MFAFAWFRAGRRTARAGARPRRHQAALLLHAARRPSARLRLALRLPAAHAVGRSRARCGPTCSTSTCASTTSRRPTACSRTRTSSGRGTGCEPGPDSRWRRARGGRFLATRSRTSRATGILEPLAEALERSVRRQRIADVPAGRLPLRGRRLAARHLGRPSADRPRAEGLHDRQPGLEAGRVRRARPSTGVGSTSTCASIRSRARRRSPRSTRSAPRSTSPSRTSRSFRRSS